MTRKTHNSSNVICLKKLNIFRASLHRPIVSFSVNPTYKIFVGENFDVNGIISSALEACKMLDLISTPGYPATLHQNVNKTWL